MTTMKDYGAEYPYVSWRRQYRRLINTMILSLATIIIFMSVLCLSIMLIPGAVEKEIIRQVAVVESSLGGNKP
jgi:hypothetical protein